MLGFFKKKIEETSVVEFVDLFAPVEGKAVKIEEVADPVFSQKLLGNGVAFQFNTDTLYAPCDAEIIMIANTKHAIGFKIANNAEFLIHVGLDTVNFGGKGFTLLTKSGYKVKRGDPLIKIDQDFFKEKGINMTTSMVMTSKDHLLVNFFKGNVNLDTPVLRVQ